MALRPTTCRPGGHWRGKLVLPAPEDPVEFAAMVVETPAPEPLAAKVNSRAEIVVGPVTIRLEEGASADRIAAIARALATTT
jgi:transposase